MCDTTSLFLAMQVFDVFERYSKGSDLKIGLAIGQSDFLAEQKALIVNMVDNKSHIDPIHLSKLRHHFDSRMHEVQKVRQQL